MIEWSSRSPSTRSWVGSDSAGQSPGGESGVGREPGRGTGGERPTDPTTPALFSMTILRLIEADDLPIGDSPDCSHENKQSGVLSHGAAQ